MTFTIVTYFVDTNILVYYRDASEAEKQRKAEHWLAELWQKRTGRLSYQVLNEYIVIFYTAEPFIKAKAIPSKYRGI